MRRFGCLVVPFVFLVSCKSIGPKEIDLDRSRYNEAIVNTHNEQLLRNIVRLRYIKPVSFIRITSVTSSYTLTPAVNGTLSLTKGPTGTDASPSGVIRSGIINPSLTYSDQPTISYVPVSGGDFIQRMLLPIPLNNIALLLNGGVDDPRSLFNIVIASIDGLDNASNASDLRTVAAPEYKRFRHLTQLFYRLEAQKWGQIRTDEIDGKVVLVMHFIRHHSQSPEAREIRAMLHIPSRYRDIILSTEKIARENSAVIEIRSMLSAMIFLSHGVQVPKEHLENKLAPLYLVTPGAPYDWNPLMKGIFNVYVSKTVPKDAYVKIYMNDYWFYIAGSDFDSIQTFSYMDMMHVLASGNAFANDSQAPVLTIPTRT